MAAWIIETLQIIATLGSVLGVYGFLRHGAKKDAKKLHDALSDRLIKLETSSEVVVKRIENTERQIENIGKTLSSIEVVLKELNIKVDQINLRLTHFEGSFEERRYWTQRECVRVDGSSQ